MTDTDTDMLSNDLRPAQPGYMADTDTDMLSNDRRPAQPGYMADTTWVHGRHRYRHAVK